MLATLTNLQNLSDLTKAYFSLSLQSSTDHWAGFFHTVVPESPRASGSSIGSSGLQSRGIIESVEKHTGNVGPRLDMTYYFCPHFISQESVPWPA